MMPITPFKSINYINIVRHKKASFKYAENISKQIQANDIDAIN